MDDTKPHRAHARFREMICAQCSGFRSSSVVMYDGGLLETTPIEGDICRACRRRCRSSTWHQPTALEAMGDSIEDI